MTVNMKRVLAAAAVALAATAPAYAGLGTGQAGETQGELFLSVWDQGTESTPGKSYVLDLGITMQDFLANGSILNSIGGDGSIEADANLTNFLTTATGPVVWTIGGISNLTTGANIYNDYGVAFSTAGTPDVSGNGNIPQGFVGIGNAIQNGSNYANAVNLSGGNPLNLAENTSYVITNTASDGYHGSSVTFNGSTGDWGGFFALDVDTAIGSAAQFYYVSLLDGSEGYTSDVQSFGLFSLANNGTLSYSAVPVPAAVWLLGSALAGLFGVARRRQLA
jgi:hypothetical protein